MAQKNTSKSKNNIGNVMREFKAGKLHTGKDPDGKGPRKAPVVKSPKQAMAIALIKAGANNKSKGKK